jgi:uncharacterized protein
MFLTASCTTAEGKVEEMKVIALEEHCASPAYLDGPGRMLVEQAKSVGAAAGAFEALCDVGEKRVAAMDAAGVDMQILSLSWPGTEQLGADEAIAVATDANDYMASASRRFPDRFSAFAALPMADPSEAVAELDRCVTELGFKGALINGHIRGCYLDDPFFSPVLRRAEELGVPLYVHPAKSPQAILDTWFGGFPPAITHLLTTGGWGWHMETAAHVVRMMAGGVFDRHPTLQIIVGHLGESLAFMLLRRQLDAAVIREKTRLERPFGSYLRENVHYTFSGFDMTPAFLNLFLEVGAERIMFSSDHPFSPMQKARQFLNHLPVSANDRNRIAGGNAAKLLNISP